MNKQQQQTSTSLFSFLQGHIMTQEVAMVFIETLDDDETVKNKSVADDDDDEKYDQLSQPDTSWKVNVGETIICIKRPLNSLKGM